MSTIETEFPGSSVVLGEVIPDTERQERKDRLVAAVETALHSGDHAPVLHTAHDALDDFTVRQDRDGQAFAFFQLGRIYSHNGEHSAALDAFNRSLTLYEQLDDLGAMAETLRHIGTIFLEWDDYVAALNYFERSIALFQKIGDLNGEATVLNDIANVSKMSGDMATSLEMYQRSLAIFEQLGIRYRQGMVLGNIASIYNVLESPETALEYACKSSELFQNTTYEYNKCVTLIIMGTAYTRMKRPMMAVEQFRDAAVIAEKLHQVATTSNCYSNMGEALITLGRLDEAKEALDHSLALLTDKIEEGGVHYCQTLGRLGSLYMNPEFSGHSDAEALRCLTEARLVGEKYDWPMLLGPIYKALAELHERHGRFAEALACLRLQFEMERRIFNENSDKRIKNLEMRSAIERARQDTEIAHLRNVELADALSEAQRLGALADERAEYNQRIAETLQETVLPTLPDQIASNLLVRTFYQPASDEAAVGGDFYDVFPMDGGRTVLVVGDVIGHGLEAAISISEVRYALRAFLSQNPSVDPGAALGQLNDFLVNANALRRQGEGASYRNRLVALTLAVIEPSLGQVCLVSAGMEPALVVRGGTGIVESVDAGDMVLGAFSSIHYQATCVQITAGDLLAVTTDGITEAFGESGKRQFGGEGLVRSLRTALLSVAQDDSELLRLQRIGESALRSVRAFIGGAFRDDVCLLLAQIAEK